MAVQLTLELRPGLTRRHKTLRAVTQWSVLNHRGGPAAIAGAVDMSPSELGRKLTGKPTDPHSTLDIDDWVIAAEELAKEGDLTPIYWLIEKFLPSDEQRRQAALDHLVATLPDILESLGAAGVQLPAAKSASKAARR